MKTIIKEWIWRTIAILSTTYCIVGMIPTARIALSCEIFMLLGLPFFTRHRLQKLAATPRIDTVPPKISRLQWQLEILLTLVIAQCCTFALVKSILEAYFSVQNWTTHLVEYQASNIILHAIRAYSWFYAVRYAYYLGTRDDPIDEVPVYAIAELRGYRARRFFQWIQSRMRQIRCWYCLIGCLPVIQLLLHVCNITLMVFYSLCQLIPQGMTNGITLNDILSHIMSMIPEIRQQFFLWPCFSSFTTNIAMITKLISGTKLSSDIVQTSISNQKQLIKYYLIGSNDQVDMIHLDKDTMFIGLGIVSVLLMIYLCLSSLKALLYISTSDCSGRPQNAEEESWAWDIGTHGRHLHQKRPPSIPQQTGESYRIVMLTIGTRGDVQPFVALGQCLRDRGHTVIISSTDNFKDFVESHGLEFSPLGVPKIEQPSHWLEVKSTGEMMERTFEMFGKFYLDVAYGFFRAVTGKPSPDSPATKPSADLILATAHTTSFGLDISEGTNIPCWTARLAPELPTPAHSSPGIPTSRFGCKNFLTHLQYWFRISQAVKKVPVEEMECQFRADAMNLPKDLGLERPKEMYYGPQLLAVSQLLFPKPLSYPDWSFSCGFWRMDSISSWNPPEWLEDFLIPPSSSWKPVVCITFGSMILATTNGIVSSCVRQSLTLGYKVLLMTGWADPPSDLKDILPHYSEDTENVLASSPRPTPKSSKRDSTGIGEPGYGIRGNVCVIRAAPHDWVFEHVAAVCHHGGAGTTAAVLAASRPSVVVPILRWADQTQYAQMVEDAGVGVQINGRRPSNVQVRRAIKKAVSDKKINDTANIKGAQVRAEASGEIAATVLESCLCSLVLPPEQAAVIKSAELPQNLTSKQKMCVRHCVPCNRLRRRIAAQLHETTSAVVDGRDVNRRCWSYATAYRLARNSDVTYGHSDALGISPSLSDWMIRGYVSFASVMARLYGKKGVFRATKALQRYHEAKEQSEHAEDYFYTCLANMFTHTRNSPPPSPVAIQYQNSTEIETPSPLLRDTISPASDIVEDGVLNASNKKSQLRKRRK